MSKTCQQCNGYLQPGLSLCPACKTAVPHGDETGVPYGLSDPSGTTTMQLPLVSGDKLGENDRFALEKILGKGSFGTVFLARDGLRNGKQVALKIAIAQKGQENLAVQQLMNEFEGRSSIGDRSHILEAWLPMTADFHNMPLLLLPMAYAEGGCLRRWMVAHPKPKARQDEALSLYRQVCSGVAAIHAAGLLHLDLKPENLLLQEGVLKVADFGLSRAVIQMSLTYQQMPSSSIGTPVYCSPEQWIHANRRGIKETADIYALGVLLFELLNGYPPFEGGDLKEKHLNCEIPDCEPFVPEHLQWAIRKALAKKPTERYTSVVEMIAALDPPVLVEKDKPWYEQDHSRFELEMNNLNGVLIGMEAICEHGLIKAEGLVEIYGMKGRLALRIVFPEAFPRDPPAIYWLSGRKGSVLRITPTSADGALHLTEAIWHLNDSSAALVQQTVTFIRQHCPLEDQ